MTDHTDLIANIEAYRRGGLGRAYPLDDLLRAAALAIEELTQERYALRAERDLAQEKLAGCFLSHRRAEARVVELERLLTLIELAAPTAIPGIAPHGIITAGTLLKVRALLASPDTTCKRCERSITDDDYEHGPGLCSAPDTTTETLPLVPAGRDPLQEMGSMTPDTTTAEEVK